MIRAVLFDFDGVLTTEATGSKPLCEAVARLAGLDPDRFRRAYYAFNNDLLLGKSTHPEIWDALCQRLGARVDIALLREAFRQTPVDPAMAALVSRVRARGLRTGMVTDNKSDRIRAAIGDFHWEGLFDAVAISAEVGGRKDGTAIFEAALGELDLPAGDCAFIDNNAGNLVVPRAMGMHTIYFDHVRRDMRGLEEELLRLGAV